MATDTPLSVDSSTPGIDESVLDRSAIIPVIDEQIHIDKRIIETGRVVLKKHVTEQREQVSVPLNHEEVNVERILINQYVDTAPEAIRYEGDTMIISVLEEVVVVEKRLMLVEGVTRYQATGSTEETHEVTLRKEEVTVTPIPGGSHSRPCSLTGEFSSFSLYIYQNPNSVNGMAQTVIGFFDTASEAQEAIDQLVKGGFSRENIDLSTAREGDTDGTTAVTSGTTSSYTDANTTTHDSSNESGIGKFFSSLFGSDDDDDTKKRASTYGQVAENSDAVVTVHASSSDEAERAADILDEAGAFDIDERAAQYGYTDQQSTDAYAIPGTVGTTGTYGATTGTTDAFDATTNTLPVNDTDENNTLKVIQEDLQIGKRTVETGGVRVRSRIVEKPVEESLRLREERVRIQRTPVDRVATDADLTAFRNGEISVTERAEVPVVNKEARVVEEISVGKEVNERTETIRDTVRNTEVDVDDTTNVNRTPDQYNTDTTNKYTTGTTNNTTDL